METWDEDYFNMETQAHIKFDKGKTGSFQFGLVRGYFHGDIYKYGREERFEFTWEGNDESNEAFGFGWVKRESKGRLLGEFRLHRGDNSKFKAIKEGYKKSLDVFNIRDRDERIAAIIKDKRMGVDERNLRKYLAFLKENISLPCKVTGIDSYFTWSNYKDRTPSGDEEFEIIGFEEDLKNYSNLFVKVRRLSDEGGVFSLQLFEFEPVNQKTIEYKILEDYTYWIENYL